MNRTILSLLLDYHRRTFGVWAVVVFIQLMQTSAMWVFGSAHMPIAGAVIAALAFYATWGSPDVVMRTLPITACELALLRWWERIGAPMLFIVLGLLIAWFANTGSRFPTPPLASLWIPVSTSFATLGLFSVLPLPMLSATRSNMPRFVVVWLALVIVSLYGLPIQWLPTPLPELLLATGSLVAFASLGLARSGRVLQLHLPARVLASLRTSHEARTARTHLRGWSALAMQWMRITFIVAFASVVLISIVRPHVRVLQTALPWMFASATVAVGTLLGQRLLRSIRLLMCLPIRTSTLALVICVAVVSPAVVASLAATAVNAIVPQWGIAIPLYMVPAFAAIAVLQLSWKGVETNAPVPAAIQQWSPILQLVAWPPLIGFMSLGLARVMPHWFELVAVASAAVLVAVAYVSVLYRVRAGVGLERYGEPLTPR
jgi:hypothetical protein